MFTAAHVSVTHNCGEAPPPPLLPQLDPPPPAPASLSPMRGFHEVKETSGVLQMTGEPPSHVSMMKQAAWVSQVPSLPQIPCWRERAAASGSPVGEEGIWLWTRGMLLLNGDESGADSGNRGKEGKLDTWFIGGSLHLDAEAVRGRQPACRKRFTAASTSDFTKRAFMFLVLFWFFADFLLYYFPHYNPMRHQICFLCSVAQNK